MTPEKQADNPCRNALDLLWQEIIIAHKPDYGDWEYPGQAYRHIKAEFEDAMQRAEKAADEAELLRAIVEKLPKDAASQPIVPGEHRWVVRDDGHSREVVVEGIGHNNTVLVGGLPGVDEDCWNEYAEDLYPAREAAEAAAKQD